MSTKLHQMKCGPCDGGTPALGSEKIDEFRKQLNADWQVIDGKKIKRDFKFKDFKEAIAFINKVADIAEDEGHHPDIYVFYNKVTLELSTHAIGGLFDNDFILSAKIDRIL